MCPGIHGVGDPGRYHPPSTHHTNKIFILSEIVSGELKTGLETDDADFFDVQNLPKLSVNRNTESQISLY